MIERHTRRNRTPRTTPEAPRRSCNRSKLPVPCAATGADKRRVTIVLRGTTLIAMRQTCYRREMAMRFCTLAFVAATACVAVAGCQGNGGAVSVRWRIANLSTGQTWDPMSFGANDGSCCSDEDPAHNCEATSIWVVRSVSVTLRDPTTDVPTP